MVHSIVTTALLAGLGGFGVFKLARLFLMWNELGFARGHTEIDRRGLWTWLDGFGLRIGLVNVLAAVGLIIGVVGVAGGKRVMPIAYGDIVMLAATGVILSVCGRIYNRLFDEFGKKVGIPVDEAAYDVSKGWS